MIYPATHDASHLTRGSAWDSLLKKSIALACKPFITILHGMAPADEASMEPSPTKHLATGTGSKRIQRGVEAGTSKSITSITSM